MIEQDGFGENARSGRDRRSRDRRVLAGLIGDSSFEAAGALHEAAGALHEAAGASDEAAGARQAGGLDGAAGGVSSGLAGASGFEADPTGTFSSNPIGEYLRKQRALRGITVDELSSMTRIPLRSLLRLEGGQFDGETDGFVRGFVRTVANALGLDEEDTMSRMLQEPSPGAWERHSTSRSVKQALAIFAFILIAIVGFLILRTGWNVLVGVTSDSGRGEVVLWQDPVRALAEATGASLDPSAEIDPGARSDR